MNVCKLNKSYSSEVGRSMVEMLGVLAVIGVLSIAGIMGYKYAMNRYQSNRIVHELNLLSNQISQIMNQIHRGDYEISLGEPYDETQKIIFGNYDYYYGCGDDAHNDRECVINEENYYQQLNGISKEICQSLVKLTQYMPHLINQTVNDKYDITGSECVSENTITLFFKTDTGDGVPNETVADILDIETPNSPEECKVEIKNFGKLKGNYYFKYVSGLSYFGGSIVNMGLSVYTGTEKIGKIADIPMQLPTTNTDEFIKYLKEGKPKYFTFDGTSDVRLVFSDNLCYDNHGSIKFQLIKVKNLPEAENSI